MKYNLEKIANDIASYDILHNNLYEFPWVSGSSTYVYPCMIWGSSIEYQLTCHENIFTDFITEILDKYKEVFISGYFWESDGSCPCTLVFVFREGVK